MFTANVGRQPDTIDNDNGDALALYDAVDAGTTITGVHTCIVKLFTHVDATHTANVNSGTDCCDDTNAAVNPSAIEECDGIDNNCNGLRDSADACIGTSTESAATSALTVSMFSAGGQSIRITS
jgi:hypothetical protein